MGQAFDLDGQLLGSAEGTTKQEVFEELNKKFNEAHEIRIKSVGDSPTQDRAHIDKPFAYHKPSTAGLEKITALREGFSRLKATIERVCPESRQRSVALTELETSAMWAIKAVVFNDPNSDVND